MKRTRLFLALVFAVLGGFLLGRFSKGPGASSAASGAGAVPGQVYTCSMHPQVRLNRPGKCPICEMPLIPATAAAAKAGAAPLLQLSDHALAMAAIETTPVTRRELTHDLRAVGKIQYNESTLATVTARVDGYAERLFVNFTGVEMKAGDHLAEIYSPELLVAQQELLIALQGGAGEAANPLVATAQLKLKRWGLTEEQILDLIKARKLTERITLYSPIEGTVIEKSIVENSAFKAGDALYRVANLDSVWVYLDIYEYDLPWVRHGQRVSLAAEALPGRVFEGRVTFVLPLVDEQTRTVRVPVHIENPDHALKPGMFVSAVVHSVLGADGAAAPTGVEGRYTCPMHPQVLRDAPGPCPNCAMKLEQISGGAAQARGPAAHGEANAAAPALPLAVPLSAVMDSGTRRLVYVARSRGMYEPREVVLGPRAGAFHPVLKGLAEGEQVVTQGGFLVDSQFQIHGLPSLFYPGGTMPGATGHQHGGAEPLSTPPATTPAPGAHKH